MQYVNGIAEANCIEHSKRSRRIANPDFADSYANVRYGFPVVRIATVLNLVELITGSLPRRGGEQSYGFLARSEPHDPVHGAIMRDIA
jgi:hypothetical protein